MMRQYGNTKCIQDLGNSDVAVNSDAAQAAWDCCLPYLWHTVLYMCSIE